MSPGQAAPPLAGRMGSVRNSRRRAWMACGQAFRVLAGDLLEKAGTRAWATLLALITARRRGGHTVTRVSLEGERQHHGRAGARAAPDLPGRGGGRREDLRHAQRGAPARRARGRRGGGLRGDARPAAHGGAAGRPGDHPAGHDRLPGRDVRGDGPRRRAGPQTRDRAGRRVRAHQRARIAARQALGRRRGTAGRGHRGHLQRQHPAPGIPQRRRPEDHRGAAAGNRAGRHGPRRRPGRAGRHHPGGAAPPDGAREHLPAGEDRRRADQLLPHRQPDRAAGAGPALAGRQGGRGPAAVPGPARHPGHLGGPRAGRGRADRRRRRARPSSAAGPGSRPGPPAATCSPCT